MLLRRVLIDRFRTIFERHGFEPIDTPTLEYLNVLTGKAGENEKLMYAFRDHGDREVGMRYDLTVPLARFVAQHESELPLPFKRYHIAPVWRAEKAQRGRLREFYQCDGDIVGSSSTTSDAEAISMVGELLAAAGLPRATIRVSHRRLLEAIARSAGIADELSTGVYRSIDKLDKVGAAGVVAELERSGVATEVGTRLVDRVSSTADASDQLGALRQELASDEAGLRAVDELAELFEGLSALSASMVPFSLDLALARGLDYYTGIVYEATVDEPKVGAVSGGGRYDDLVATFTGRPIPANGLSLGIERLIEVVNEFDLVQAPATVCDAIVIYGDGCLAYAGSLARDLRGGGLNVDLSVATRRGFGDQLKYAGRREIPVALIVGEAERDNGSVTVKNLVSGDQETVARESVAKRVETIVAATRATPA
jgi:histidyl-tRNA synthetase